MLERLNFQSNIPSDQVKSFEVSLCVLNYKGEPTNRRKTFASDDAFEIWQFWNRNRGKPRKKRNKVGIATKSEAEKVLKEEMEPIWAEKEEEPKEKTEL